MEHTGYVQARIYGAHDDVRPFGLQPTLQFSRPEQVHKLGGP